MRPSGRVQQIMRRWGVLACTSHHEDGMQSSFTRHSLSFVDSLRSLGLFCIRTNPSTVILSEVRSTQSYRLPGTNTSQRSGETKDP